MAQFILEEGSTEYFCSANISFVIAGPTGAGKMAGLRQIGTAPTQPQHCSWGGHENDSANISRKQY